MEFRQTKLENGLEIVAECNPDARVTALGFFVKTGSRDETPELAGVSHFLEHMAFKGTKQRTAEDVNREFDAMGAENNAFTSKETTAYWAALLPDHLEGAVDVLADILRPALRPEDFETEKQVIIEEIKMYEDQPPFGADEKCEELHFGTHPLGHNVLGSVDSVTRLSVDQMRNYFEKRYSPGNIALVAAGAVDFDKLVDLTNTRCGSWQPFATERKIELAGRHPGFHVLHKENSAQQYVVQLSDAPGAESPQRHAADLLSTILGDSSGSRLYWNLIDTGAAEHAGLYYVEYQGGGIFWTMMSCDPENAQANLRALHAVYRNAEQDGITEVELAQAKSKTKARLVLAGERSRRRLFAVGGNWVARGKYMTIREELELVDAVTVDDVNRILRDFPLTTSTAVTIGPVSDIESELS